MWKINCDILVLPFSKNVDILFTITENVFPSRCLLSEWFFRCHCVNNKVANDKLKIDRMIEIGWIKREHLQHEKKKTHGEILIPWIVQTNPMWNKWMVFIKL